jgi:hypothetical protein
LASVHSVKPLGHFGWISQSGENCRPIMLKQSCNDEFAGAFAHLFLLGLGYLTVQVALQSIESLLPESRWFIYYLPGLGELLGVQPDTI